MNPNDYKNWGSESNSDPNDGFKKPDWITEDKPSSEKSGTWDFMPDPRLQQGSAPKGPSLPDDWAQRLTEEDKRVIKECNSESFYRRSLPLGVMTIGINTYYHIQKNVSLKSFPLQMRNILLGGLSFVVGKLLYAPFCVHKIEALNENNSFLKQKLIESKANQKNGSPMMNPPVQKIQTPLRPYDTTPKAKSPFEQQLPPSKDRFSHLPDFSSEKNPEQKGESSDVKFKYDDDKPFSPYSDDEFRPKSF